MVTRLGLTDQTFRATLARFHRLKGQLPEELRRSAMEVMIQDGGPQAATVSRRAGRPVELHAVAASREPVNDSADSLDALEATEGDGLTDGSQDAA